MGAQSAHLNGKQAIRHGVKQGALLEISTCLFFAEFAEALFGAEKENQRLCYVVEAPTSWLPCPFHRSTSSSRQAHQIQLLTLPIEEVKIHVPPIVRKPGP